MSPEEKARQEVREYLDRCQSERFIPSEADALAQMEAIAKYGDYPRDLIPLSEMDRGAWFACVWFLNNTDETPGGEVGFVSDEKKLDPAFRKELQKWAHRALMGQIQIPPSGKGPKAKPLRDHSVVVAVYKATLFGLPEFSSGNSTRLTACGLVAEEIGLSPDAVKTIWQKRPKPRGE